MSETETIITTAAGPVRIVAQGRACVVADFGLPDRGAGPLTANGVAYRGHLDLRRYDDAPGWSPYRTTYGSDGRYHTDDAMDATRVDWTKGSYQAAQVTPTARDQLTAAIVAAVNQWSETPAGRRQLAISELRTAERRLASATVHRDDAASAYADALAVHADAEAAHTAATLYLAAIDAERGDK